MKNKSTDIESFARYAKQVNQYKKNTGAYQQKVEYIKSLFEVGGETSLCVPICVVINI